MDKETLARWNKYYRGRKSPLNVGDIVKIKAIMLLDHPKNKNRLARVTKVKKELAETGYVVNVKVNVKDQRPIYEDGNPCYSLSGYSCAYFILVEKKKQ